MRFGKSKMEIDRSFLPFPAGWSATARRHLFLIPFERCCYELFMSPQEKEDSLQLRKGISLESFPQPC